MDFDKISKELHLEISNELAVIQGGNSSVVKAKLKDNALIAIKIYKGEPSRVQRMLAREQSAISYLTENNFHNIPEILEVRKDLGIIVYRWIEGEPPIPNTKCMEAIIEMCLALNNINKIDGFENAVDAAFSIQDIEFQILERINLLTSEHKYQFAKTICLSLEEKLQKYRSIFSENHKLFPHTMSISDLGTHNMLYAEGSFSFIDFEFFGYDSVDKMVGDFLLHPHNKFKQNEIVKFKESISNKLGWRSKNLNFILPILSLKWAAIAFKRELKELKISYSEEGIKVFLYTSKGMKYLEYFEYLISGEPVDSVSTFNQFTAKI
jgi:tRNA A-37 threonylcarbamoyl transferase component Bud32